LRQSPGDEDIRHNRDLVARALRQRQQSHRNGSGSRQPGGRGTQSTAGGQKASNGARAGAGQSGSSGQHSDTPQASDDGRSSKEASGEAQRDATFAASVARAQQQQGGARGASAKAGSKGAGQAPARDGLDAGGAQTPQQKPESERQLMLDQWLRQIPDSPAGLLQRQFLIDHMMRQENGPAEAP
jgi:Ca-activated chloride channel homolog